MKKCKGCDAYVTIKMDENDNPLAPHDYFVGCIARIEDTCKGDENHEVNFTLAGIVNLKTDKETASDFFGFFTGALLSNYLEGFPECGSVE